MLPDIYAQSKRSKLFTLKREKLSFLSDISWFKFQALYFVFYIVISNLKKFKIKKYFSYIFTVRFNAKYATSNIRFENIFVTFLIY